MTFLVGLDLGQVNDYTALCVIETTPSPAGNHYAIRHLDRALQLSYPAVVEQITALLKQPRLNGAAPLVIDKSGVGRGVTDLFRTVPALSVVGVTFTGGNTVHQDGADYNTPKKDLIAAIHATGGTGRLKYASSLKYADILDRELLALKRKFVTNNVQYDTWREGEHDDLLFAVAIAVWWGDRGRPFVYATDGRPAPAGVSVRLDMRDRSGYPFARGRR